jgi:polysaccharide biosynthesis protein PslH
MRILFLSRWYPFPPDNGSKLRIYNLLCGLAKYHQVTLLSFIDKASGLKELNDAQEYCEDIKTVPWKPFDPQSRRSLIGYFSSRPRSFIDTYSTEMANLIEQSLGKKPFDMVIASQVDMAAYYELFRGYPALFEEVEVGAFHQKYSFANFPVERSRRGLMWWKYKKFLTRSMESFRYCTVVSEPEKLLLEQIGVRAEKITVIPNSIAMDPVSVPSATPEQNSLIFPGSILFYANYDAVTWFLEEIFPMIRNRIPNAQLKITGEYQDLTLPNETGVVLTGYVDDIKPLIARTWVSLAPIRQGGGTRLKILESMSLGTPVVSTSKGAEGLDVKHEQHLLIADDPQEFAGAVIRLLSDLELRTRLAENGLKLVAEKYNWATNIVKFLNLVERTAQDKANEVTPISESL